MSENLTLARPYAAAVFDLAQEQGELKKWSDMLALAAGVAADPEMAALIDNPLLTRERLTALFLEVCGSKLNTDAANFVRLLIDNKRIDLLPEIATQFEARRAESEGRIAAEVISAFDLEPAQIKKIGAALKTKLGREVDITTRVDGALIGGMIIRAGDLVIDGSVRGRLAALASQLQR